MNNIEQFFLNFGQYCKDADIFWSVLMPIITLLSIWLLTVAGLRIFNKKDRLRTVFVIHRAVIISALSVAMVLVAIICYCWSKNVFAGSHLELALLISLVVAFAVPFASLLVLRQYWEKTRINEIINQPISAERANSDIPVVNKAFNKNKIYYVLPFIGFLLLFFSLNSGKNLISIVFDNSVSMDLNAATNALTKTFDKLNENNEIIFTNLNNTVNSEHRKKLKDILAAKQSNKIKVGSCHFYQTPEEAKRNFQSTISAAEGSPICEVIWKMWLFTKENRANTEYKNKLLIIITDGEENWIDINDLRQNKFFFDNTEFAEYYTPENIHVVDYSEAGDGIVIKKFEENGATVYSAVTSVDDYLSALDDALISFQNNKYLIIWTIVICVIFTLIGLVVTHKRITI